MLQEGWQSSNIQILNIGALDACLALIFTGPVLQQRLEPSVLIRGCVHPGSVGMMHATGPFARSSSC